MTDLVIRSGSLDVAVFLLSVSKMPITSALMDSTVRCGGQLDLVQWMYNNGGEDCSSRAIDYAASNGHLEIVQWLHSKGLGCSTFAMDYAAMNGHLAVVKFLHENRSKGCTPAAFESAVNNNRLDVAQYLLEHRSGDCTASVRIDGAARDDGLEMLRWLQATGVTTECAVNTMDVAAANGHLDVVQFLHEHRTEGCTVNAMTQAASNGHLEVVKWLHFNRTEGCTPAAMDHAAANGHLVIVKFLHENRSEGCTTDAMDRAASKGHLNVVKFLHENRAEGCTTQAIDRAHNMEILRWLGENRREGFTHRALDHAAFGGDLEKLAWLHDRAPADMWTQALAKTMALSGEVEALEWFAHAYPELVDARALLLPPDRQKWWVWIWLCKRIQV